MRLKGRAFIVTLLIAGPISFGLLLSFRAVMGSVVDNITTAFVQARFPDLQDGACSPSIAKRSYEIGLPLGRAGPATTPGHTIPAHTYFYSPNGHSQAFHAPSLPVALTESKGATLSSKAMDVVRAGKSLRYVLVQLYPVGPCSQALVVTPVQRPIPLPIVFGPLLLLILAVPAAVAPMVERTKKLSEALRVWRGEPDVQLPKDHTQDELGDLSRAFDEAARSMGAREQRSRRFVEDVSHDLASPLTVLQAHLSAMERESNSPAIRHAKNEAHYLAALLGSLRTTLTVESEEGVSAPVDLGEVVRRVSIRHQAWAEGLGVALEYSVPPEPVIVQGDVTFAEQALTNLVGNALAHGRTCRHLAVVLNTQGAGFKLSIRDDGEGLAAKDCEQVLVRGRRGKGAGTLNPNGRGLGLSIVARVAEAHGWKFLLHPNEPKGLAAELSGSLT